MGLLEDTYCEERRTPRYHIYGTASCRCGCSCGGVVDEHASACVRACVRLGMGGGSVRWWQAAAGEAACGLCSVLIRSSPSNDTRGERGCAMHTKVVILETGLWLWPWLWHTASGSYLSCLSLR